MNKPKLLVICGPTAIGKTALGITLAQQFDGEIISADSRQVYKGLDIGSGKLRSDTIQIWGYDLVSPTEEFSVSHFQSFAKEKIQEINDGNKLPILVGGTGLYISSIIGNLSEVSAPRDEALRKQLNGLSAEELYELLLKTYPQRAHSLNESDKKNPIRLIRAFERDNQDSANITSPNGQHDLLIIGLTADSEILSSRIEASVSKRIAEGFDDEVRRLLASGIPVTSKAFTGTGYRQWIPFVQGEITKEQATADWVQAEKQYVKRQLTWFKKQKEVNWFDISKETYQREVEEIVRTWHNSV